MARSHANNGRIYRAVITRIYGDTFRADTTTTYGPYDQRHTAQAQITCAVNEALMSLEPYANPWRMHIVSGHIESAEVIWKKESG